MKRVSLLGILVLTAVVSYFFLVQEEDHSFKKSKTITAAGTKKLFLGARKSLPAPAQFEGQVAQDNCSDITAQLKSIDLLQSKNTNPDSYQARIQLGFDYQDLYN